jgi:hypothetical protein
MGERRLLLISGLHVPGPGQFQAADVFGIDLVECAIAGGAIIAAPHQPVFWRRLPQHRVGDGLECLQDIVAGDCAGVRNQKCRRAEGDKQNRTHGDA